MSDHLTDFGFTFGAAEVCRSVKLSSGHVCITIRTGYGSIDVYVSATGRSLRAFKNNRDEMKTLAVWYE